MFPILQLGPLAIQTPGLFLLAGLWVGVTLVEKEALRRNLSPASLTNMILVGMVLGVVGARLGYALRFLDVYWDNPLGLISLNPTTLAPTEGFLIGLLAAGVYGQRKELPFWLTLDALGSGLAVFALALGFSHLASGDAFGAPTSVLWAIELWGEKRHPSQIYEILAAVLILLAVWRLGKRETFPGFTFLSWLALTGLGRLFLEAFRGDSRIVFGGLRSAQLISLSVLLVSMLGMHLLARRETPVGKTASTE
jgi:prolipoprotein diacylglyceryltransferase